MREQKQKTAICRKIFVHVFCQKECTHFQEHLEFPSIEISSENHGFFFTLHCVHMRNDEKGLSCVGYNLHTANLLLLLHVAAL